MGVSQIGDEYGIRANAICPGPVDGLRIENVIRSRAEYHLPGSFETSWKV